MEDLDEQTLKRLDSVYNKVYRSKYPIVGKLKPYQATKKLSKSSSISISTLTPNSNSIIVVIVGGIGVLISGYLIYKKLFQKERKQKNS